MMTVEICVELVSDRLCRAIFLQGDADQFAHTVNNDVNSIMTPTCNREISYEVHRDRCPSRGLWLQRLKDSDWFLGVHTNDLTSLFRSFQQKEALRKATVFSYPM